MATAGRSGRPGWLPDETASAGRENLDPDHVAHYDLKEDADAAREVELCRRLGLTHESTVAEFGPGTGQFTLAVAPFCARVVAVDVSPVMIAALRAKLRRADVRNVHVVNAGFLSYTHEGPPADLVYSRYALHHLPDLWKAVALSRLFTMLRPGGVLRLWDVVYDFDPADAPDRLEAWCATAGAGGVDTWGRADIEEHIRDEHSTFTWLLEPMMLRAGFVVEDAARSGDGITARYILRRPPTRSGAGR